MKPAQSKTTWKKGERVEVGGRGGGNVSKPFVTYGIIPCGWIIKGIVNARTSITLIVCDATAMKSYIISSSVTRGEGNKVKV